MAVRARGARARVGARAKRALWACALSALALSAGCASGPLVVSAMQSRGDSVKFGYTKVRGGDQGIIECQAGASGDLHSCRHMKIQFAD